MATSGGPLFPWLQWLSGAASTALEGTGRALGAVGRALGMEESWTEGPQRATVARAFGALTQRLAGAGTARAVGPLALGAPLSQRLAAAGVGRAVGAVALSATMTFSVPLIGTGTATPAVGRGADFSASVSTRLYFSQGDAPSEGVTPAYAAGWTQTTHAVRRAMGLDVLLTGIDGYGVWSSGDTASANASSLGLQLVSPPMPAGIAFATTDTVRGVISALQAIGTLGMNRQPFALTVVSRDGGTLRATLHALAHAGPSTDLWPTSYGNRQYADGDALEADYMTLDGDRLVLEIGSQLSATPTSGWGASLASGRLAGTDLAENETDTGLTADPWFSISRALTFLPEAVLRGTTRETGAVGTGALTTRLALSGTGRQPSALALGAPEAARLNAAGTGRSSSARGSGLATPKLNASGTGQGGTARGLGAALTPRLALAGIGRAGAGLGTGTANPKLNAAGLGRAGAGLGTGLLSARLAAAGTGRALGARGLADLSVPAYVSGTGRATGSVARALGLEESYRLTPARSTPARGLGADLTIVSGVAWNGTGRAGSGRARPATMGARLALTGTGRATGAVGHAQTGALVFLVGTGMGTPARAEGVLAARLALAGTGRAGAGVGHAVPSSLGGPVVNLGGTGRALWPRGRALGLEIAWLLSPARASQPRGFATVTLPATVFLTGTGRALGPRTLPADPDLTWDQAPGVATGAVGRGDLSFAGVSVALAGMGRATSARAPAAAIGLPLTLTGTSRQIPARAQGQVAPRLSLLSFDVASGARTLSAPLTARLRLTGTGRATPALALGAPLPGGLLPLTGAPGRAIPAGRGWGVLGFASALTEPLAGTGLGTGARALGADLGLRTRLNGTGRATPAVGIATVAQRLPLGGAGRAVLARARAARLLFQGELVGTGRATGARARGLLRSPVFPPRHPCHVHVHAPTTRTIRPPRYAYVRLGADAMLDLMYLELGQTLPIFHATLLQADEQPVDLTDATVTLQLRRYLDEGERGPEPPLLEFPCIVLAPYPAGVVEYTWQPGDIPTAGNYRGVLHCVWPTGDKDIPTVGFLSVFVTP